MAILSLSRGRISQLCNGKATPYGFQEAKLIEGVDWIRTFKNGRAAIMYSRKAIYKLKNERHIF